MGIPANGEQSMCSGVHHYQISRLNSRCESQRNLQRFFDPVDVNTVYGVI